MKSLRTRALCYGLVILLGLLSALPNVLPGSFSQSLPDWYAGNKVSLGLDLRGGSHLLLAVDTEQLTLARSRQQADALADALRKAGIHHGRPAVAAELIRVTPTSPAQLDKALDIVRSLARDDAGMLAWLVDEQDGQVTLRMSPTYKEAMIKDAVERSLEVVHRRLDETGLVEPTITRQGSDGVLVQLPGVTDPGHIRKLLGTTAQMSFHWAANARSASETRIMTVPGEAGEQYRLEKRVALEGKHISDARLAYNPDTGLPVVNFRLDKEGAGRFADMTRENLGRVLAVVLDGRVITAPVIRGVIGSAGEISGSFTPAEAGDLALLLRAGALPAPLEVVEERTVGPGLGSDSIAMGVSTGIVGALLVVLFMLGIYGRWGLIACVGLTIYVGMVIGVLSVLGATLTLPGIAGLILSLGMAVDANILINERIREETRRGKAAWQALDAGFRRAYGTILDSNLTTLIAVSLLFLFGSGAVRGFAVTMAVGLLMSLFTAISVTRLLMEWRVRGMGRQSLAISGIKALDRISENTVGFMKGRHAGLIASAVLSLAALVLFVKPGLPYGIDFTGGTLVEVHVPGTSVASLRETLERKGLEQAAIQEFGEAGEYLVRLPTITSGQGVVGQQVDALKAVISETHEQADFPRVEMVGPKVSGGFADATILAVLLAGGGMLAYLWFRFESHFALAATTTILLDITKTIGFFVLAGIEFNLTAVAALLALIGYSVNDKVVVFDRVRENLRLTPDKPLLQLLDESITSTLTRTVFTSVTTFLALLPMALAGGPAVASFAWPMLFGIVIGTSSSVFIAAPILYRLGQRRLRKGLPQLRPTAEEMKKQLALIP